VTNWPAYEAGLRQRGSLTIWFSEEAVAAWRAPPQTTPSGQARYSDLAVETALILRTVFHQPLRQTEGLVGSLLELMGLDLPVPDHSTLSRRSRTLTVAPQETSGPVCQWALNNPHLRALKIPHPFFGRRRRNGFFGWIRGPGSIGTENAVQVRSGRFVREAGELIR
jgi:hypothetical protein